VSEATLLSNPECPYAATKQMGEQIIQDFSKSVGITAALLRYFNPVGAHPSGLNGEVPFEKPNNLVPVITQTAIGLQPSMKVWGSDYDTRDGSCIRDYVHVMDIARAHALAIDYLVHRKNESGCEIFNVGSGLGVSVLEAIASFERISGLKLNYTIGSRRVGDVAAIYGDNQRITTRLGWTAQYGLDDMMANAWAWEQRLANKE
jgi:UDP-glucose 4-epimerase